MAKLNEGDKVRVVTRPVTEEDRKVHMFFEHMCGLTGTVANYYNKNEVAVNIDLDSLGKIPADVHDHATDRMRARFGNDVTEEQRKLLDKDELNFTPNYVLLVREQDLEPLKG